MRTLGVVEGEIMGREEKRLRDRSATQLTKRLGRVPTEEEIEKDVASQLEAQGLAPRLGRDAAHPVTARRGQRPR